MRAAAIPALSVLAGALLAGTACGATIDRDFHESFDVEEGYSLILRSGDGDVTVRPWDQDVIDVTVRYRADIERVGFGEDPDFDVEFEHGDDYVRVMGRVKQSGPSIFRMVRRHEYAYMIKAPPYVALQIDGDDGDIDIRNWSADIDCDVDDGDVYLETIENSRTELSLDDGDCTLRALTGSLSVSADDGDLSISDCALSEASLDLDDGDVSARTSAGDFAVSVDDGDVTLDLLSSSSTNVRADDGTVSVEVGTGVVEEISVDTNDGNVMISMPPGSSYSFRVTTDDGGIRIELPDPDTFEKDENSASGTVRGGGGRVSVRTDDGDVILLEG